MESCSFLFSTKITSWNTLAKTKLLSPGSRLENFYFILKNLQNSWEKSS